MMTDETYAAMQAQVELVSRLLISFDPEDLAAFIERGQRSLSISPILHPSEVRAGVDKLELVLNCAGALRDARERIAGAADL